MLDIISTSTNLSYGMCFCVVHTFTSVRMLNFWWFAYTPLLSRTERHLGCALVHCYTLIDTYSLTCFLYYSIL